MTLDERNRGDRGLLFIVMFSVAALPSPLAAEIAKNLDEEVRGRSRERGRGFISCRGVRVA